MTKKPALLGLYQAVGVAAYCGLVAFVFWAIGNSGMEAPGPVGFLLFLMLFVFSAAITGSLVFGYAGYLAIQKQLPEAIKLVGFTLLYCLIILCIIAAVLFLFMA